MRCSGPAWRRAADLGRYAAGRNLRPGTTNTSLDISSEERSRSIGNLVPALVGLFGATAGALLQYWLSRRTMRESRQSEQVSRAYSDYLLGVAGVAQAQRHNDDTGMRASLRQVADAKTRIAAHGDSEVIATMATFERLGAKLATSEQKRAFVSIIHAMRSNGASKHKAAVFRAALGLNASDAPELREWILRAAVAGEAFFERSDEFGDRYRLDFEIATPSGRAMVRSAWIIRADEDFPRLTTRFVLPR
jgi:hypothetical protein